MSDIFHFYVSVHLMKLNVSDEHRLKMDLLYGYDPDARPVPISGSATLVHLGFVLLQLFELVNRILIIT